MRHYRNRSYFQYSVAKVPKLVLEEFFMTIQSFLVCEKSYFLKIGRFFTRAVNP